MRWLWVVVALAGCSGENTPDPAVRRAEQRREAIKRSEIAAQQPPKVTRHRLEQGELLVLDVPVVLSYGILDSAKCFIWRDLEFKTSTINCPSGIEGPVPDDHAGPEKER